MKLKIALRNLYISQAIILLFLLFAYIFWFPHSFAELGGFFDTAWMLIFVDLILGPLLVFLIYKENKKNLKFDINFLLSIQLVAFIFGAYSLFLKHPAYAVFSNDRFILTNISNIYPKPSKFDLLKNHFFSSPELVFAKLPETTLERNNFILSVSLKGEPDIESRPKYFKPLNTHIDKVLKKSINLKDLDLGNREQKILNSFFNKHKKDKHRFAYFSLSGNDKKEMIWVFDTKLAKPIEILDINPWKLKPRFTKIIL